MEKQAQNISYNAGQMTGQAQANKDQLINQASDTQKSGQDTSLLQQTGEQVKNMAHGAATIAQGAVQGTVNMAQGAAQGAANIAQGASQAVKNTLGANTDTTNTNRPSNPATNSDYPNNPTTRI